MKSKKGFLLKRLSFLTPILSLALIFGVTSQVLADQIFYETFPNADSAWNGSSDTAQAEPNWVTIQGGDGDSNDIQVSNEDVASGTLPPSGGNHLTFEDCDTGAVIPNTANDLACVLIDLSGYANVVIEYYWQSDDDVAGEWLEVSYSTDATNCTDGTWTQIGYFENQTDDTWNKETYNLPDADAVSNFRLRFASKSISGMSEKHFYVDDIKVTGTVCPTLNWTGDTNFESDGVHPDGAATGSTFEFRVEYTHAEDTAPTVKQVWVDLDDSGTYETGEKFTMDEVNTGDTVYTDGKDYTYSRAITRSGDGTINYRFYFSDGTYDATGDPTTDHTFMVLLGDNAPTLNWTGDTGFVSDGINPDSAVSGFTFEFQVKYTDADNDPPTVKQVWVDLDDSETYETGEKFDMTLLAGSDYTQGVDYTKSMIIYHPGGSTNNITLNYTFYFSDGLYDATGDPTSDHTFTVEAAGGIYHVSTSGNDNNTPYESWAHAARYIQTAVTYASNNRGGQVATVIVEAGTYSEDVTMKDQVHVINKPGDTPLITGN